MKRIYTFQIYFKEGIRTMTGETFKFLSFVLFVFALITILFGVVYGGILAHPIVRNIIFLWLGFWFGLTAYVGLKESSDKMIKSNDDERFKRERYIERLEKAVKKLGGKIHGDEVTLP